MANNESRVIITADSAQAIREFGRLRTQSTSSLKDIASYSDNVGAALGAIGLTTGLAGIVRMSDEYAKFTSQLRLATVSQNEYNAAYADVKRIANASQQAMAATGTLYARIANGTRELGTTQKQVAEITETVNLALMVSGATATESASAQLQLSQAFASGTLRGEEFNAVNEAAPRLMKALADGMGLPIGALKGMAGEGLITSKIMAEVLPNALASLREEGKKIATIGGALTVLKNEFMEFTAVKAQANGTVNILTTSIKLLSDNLDVLFAATAALTTAKLAGYFFAGVAAVQAYFASNAELAALLVVERAALISKAEALVASTTAVATSTTAKLAETQATLTGLAAQKTALLTARELIFAQYKQAKANIASAEAAIAAASAAGALSFALRVVRTSTLDLAVAEQARTVALAEMSASSIALGRISAQLAAATASVTTATAADTAATAARTAATNGLNGAIGRTTITASLASKALGFLGGPIGIITTLLSVGAAAWVLWGSKGSEAEKQVTATLAEEIDEYLENLNKQIEKLKERNELAGKKMTTGAAPVTESEKSREKILAEINSIGKRVDLDSSAKNALMALWGGKLNKIDVDAANFDTLQEKNKAFTRNADIKTWLGQNGSAAQKMAAELDELKKKFGELTPEVEKIVRAKYEDKGIAAALNKEQSAYESLIASIRTKTAENNIEAKTDQNASESQKMRIKLDETMAVGKLKLSAAHQTLAKDALAAMEASEAAKKQSEQEKDAQDTLLESTTARHASTAALAAEYAMYGKSSDARALEMIAVKAQADQEKYLLEAKIKGRIVTGDQLKALTAEKDARVLVEQATLAQTAALNYAAGLKVDNEKFAAESIADPKARADALLKIDADIWRDRIALAGAGTEAQKLLQTEFNTWYANQSIKVVLDVDVTRATEVLKILESMDAAARSAASGMADSFGSVGEAIGGLTTALSGYAVQQQAIAAQLATVKADPKNSADKIAKAEIAAARDSAQAKIKSYGDMASAAKGFFKENSTGYKLMEGAEKGIRALEMAGQLEKLATSLFVSSASAAGVVAGQTVETGAVITGQAAQNAAKVPGVFMSFMSAMGPWGAAAAAAAIAAVLGGAFSGGGASVDIAAQRQESAGTGSVLGDESAKSESLSRSLELAAKNSSIELTHTNGMLNALIVIRDNISNLAALATQTSGLRGTALDEKNYGVGSSSGFLGIGSSSTTLKDSGINIAAGQTVGSVVDSGILAKGYADIEKKKSGLWGLGSSTKTSRTTTELDAALTKQLSLTIESMRTGTLAAIDVLGVGGAGVVDAINKMGLDIGEISFKGLTGTEIEDQLSAIFSKVGDRMADIALPALTDFQKVGEGLFETLTRVAANYANLDSIMESIGSTFGATGVESIAARERLIALTGGIDELASQTSSFADNFMTEAERLAPVQKYVAEQLAALGYAGLNTRDDFKAAVMGLADSGALATKAGAESYAGLLGISEAFAKTHAANEDLTMSQQAIADQTKDLQSRYDELTMTSAQLREKERKAVDATNLALYDRVAAEEAKKAAIAETNDILALQAQMYAANDDRVSAAAVLLKQHTAALVGMTPALAAATQATWDAQAAEKVRTEALAEASTRRGIEIAIMTATGDAAGALAATRSEELAALQKTNPALVALKETMYAVQDAAALAKTNRAINIQIMELEGNKLGALAATRADELVGLDASTAALIEHRNALTDATALTKTNRALDIQIMELTGDKIGALAATRADELVGLDASTAALIANRNALQDQAAAAAAAVTGANTAFSTLKNSVDAEKTRLDAAYQAQADAVKAAADGVKSQIDAINSQADKVRSVFDKIGQAMASTVIEADAYDLAQRRAAQDLLARAAVITRGGGVADIAGLDEALATISKPTTQLFGTFEEWARDQARTGSTLAALQLNAKTEIDYAALTVAGLNGTIGAIGDASASQLAMLEQQHRIDIAAQDALLATAQGQLDVTLGLKSGLDTGLLSIADALKQFAVALGVVKETPSALSVTGMFQQVLGRAPQQAGLDFWTKAYGDSVDGKELADFINSAQPELNAKANGTLAEFLRANGVPGFDVGTNLLPADMLAMVHEGERIIPAADNRELMARLSSPSGNNAELVAEIRLLRAEVAKLKEPLLRTATATGESATSSGKLAQQFDQVSSGGNNLRTKVIA